MVHAIRKHWPPPGGRRINQSPWVPGVISPRTPQRIFLNLKASISRCSLLMSGDVQFALSAVNDFDEAMKYFQDISHSQYLELAEEQWNKAQALVNALDAQ